MVSSNNSLNGFTLPELLVSMAIGSLVIGLGYSLFAVFITIESKNIKHLQSFIEETAVLEKASKTSSCAVFIKQLNDQSIEFYDYRFQKLLVLNFPQTKAAIQYQKTLEVLLIKSKSDTTSVLIFPFAHSLQVLGDVSH